MCVYGNMFFTGQLPFVMLSQHSQSTEGASWATVVL